jgi:hypothetical protein
MAAYGSTIGEKVPSTTPSWSPSTTSRTMPGSAPGPRRVLGARRERRQRLVRSVGAVVVHEDRGDPERRAARQAGRIEDVPGHAGLPPLAVDGGDGLGGRAEGTDAFTEVRRRAEPPQVVGRAERRVQSAEAAVVPAVLHARVDAAAAHEREVDAEALHGRGLERERAQDRVGDALAVVERAVEGRRTGRRAEVDVDEDAQRVVTPLEEALDPDREPLLVGVQPERVELVVPVAEPRLDGLLGGAGAEVGEVPVGTSAGGGGSSGASSSAATSAAWTKA